MKGHTGSECELDGSATDERSGEARADAVKPEKRHDHVDGGQCGSEYGIGVSFWRWSRPAWGTPSSRWCWDRGFLRTDQEKASRYSWAQASQRMRAKPCSRMPQARNRSTTAGMTARHGPSVWGVPGMGVKNNAGRYLENLQTEPDIQIFNEQGVVGRGRDQQLEAAVAELQRKVR